MTARPGESFSAALASRIEALRKGPAFANYLLARDRVLDMKEREVAEEREVAASAREMAASEGEASGPEQGTVASSDSTRPSGYWREELEGFEYMLDASPLVIEKLRHHTYHLTGLRVYDYRTHAETHRQMLERKLDALLEMGGEDLAVPESPALGGFGFELQGALWNVDTLKFLECSLALRRGAVLPELEQRPGRLVVWEIGGGWGGYAYHFKTLFPNTTYVLTDLPEVLLFSATYLMTVFPEARVRFHAPGDDGSAFADPKADFVFVAHTALEETRLERIDLALNMVSFQEMTTAQVRSYARHAWELGCPWLYSLNRDRSNYNVEISSVGEVLRECYWTVEIPMLPVSYPQPLPSGWRERRREPPADRYKHLVGWPRIRL